MKILVSAVLLILTAQAQADCVDLSGQYKWNQEAEHSPIERISFEQTGCSEFRINEQYLGQPYFNFGMTMATDGVGHDYYRTGRFTTASYIDQTLEITYAPGKAAGECLQLKNIWSKVGANLMLEIHEKCPQGLVVKKFELESIAL